MTNYFFDNWNPVLRWILFLPYIGVIYVIGVILSTLSLSWAIGPFDPEVAWSYIIWRFQFAFILVAAAISFGVQMAPKGKIIICSVILGLIIFFSGIALTAWVYDDTGEFDTWHIFYDLSCYLAAGILSLVATIIETKKQNYDQETDSELMKIYNDDSKDVTP